MPVFDYHCKKCNITRSEPVVSLGNTDFTTCSHCQGPAYLVNKEQQNKALEEKKPGWIKKRFGWYFKNANL